MWPNCLSRNELCQFVPLICCRQKNQILIPRLLLQVQIWGMVLVLGSTLAWLTANWVVIFSALPDLIYIVAAIAYFMRGKICAVHVGTWVRNLAPVRRNLWQRFIFVDPLLKVLLEFIGYLATPIVRYRLNNASSEDEDSFFPCFPHLS